MMIVLNPEVLKGQVHHDQDLLHKEQVLRDLELHLGDLGNPEGVAQEENLTIISVIALIADVEEDLAVTIKGKLEQISQTEGRSITSMMMEHMRKSLMSQKTSKA